MYDCKLNEVFCFVCAGDEKAHTLCAPLVLDGICATIAYSFIFEFSAEIQSIFAIVANAGEAGAINSTIP